MRGPPHGLRKTWSRRGTSVQFGGCSPREGPNPFKAKPTPVGYAAGYCRCSPGLCGESYQLTMKGSQGARPDAKMENHFKRSPASARNRLRILALAWSKAFSLMPSSAATCAARTPSRAKRRSASQVVGWNSLDDRQQPLEDVMVVVPVPLAGQLAVRGLQSVEESDGRVEPDGRPASPAPVVAPGLVDRHLPQPGATGPRAAARTGGTRGPRPRLWGLAVNPGRYGPTKSSRCFPPKALRLLHVRLGAERREIGNPANR